MNIQLIEWNLDNIDDLIYLCNHADRTYLTTRMPYPYSKDDALWYIDYIDKCDKDGYFRAIYIDNKIAGTISIERKDDVSKIDSEIGYHLLKEYHGKGIMSKVVEEVVKLAFGSMDILRITGEVYEPNIASRRVLEKNGFVLEGVKKKAIIKDNIIYNLCIYGKCKE